jgi:hypothetical protein
LENYKLHNNGSSWRAGEQLHQSISTERARKRRLAERRQQEKLAKLRDKHSVDNFSNSLVFHLILRRASSHRVQVERQPPEEGKFLMHFACLRAFSHDFIMSPRYELHHEAN